MNDGKSTRNVIESYRKRRQQNQVFIIWGGAALLILIGLILLVIWLTGPSTPLSGMFATETPTPTLTFTSTVTTTPTETPTVTATFTETPTPTQSAPYSYIVQEGDYLATIAENQNLGPDGVALILLLNNYTDEGANFSIDPTTQIVYPGQEILLPNPGMELPTATTIPPDLSRGTILSYTIQAGDTLAGIADLFNSTVDEIIRINELDDPNAIFVGQQLDIPVNLVTATATFPPTSTPLTPLASTSVPTATP
jgi:LysM repeat protein